MVCCVSLSIGLGIWFYIESTKEEPVDGYWSDWSVSVPCKGDYGGTRTLTRTCTEPVGNGKQCVEIDGGQDSKSEDCITFAQYTKQKQDEKLRLEHEQEQLAATAERERLARKSELTDKWAKDPNSLTEEERNLLFDETDSVSREDVEISLLSTLKTQLDEAEKTYKAIKDGIDTFISVEEAGKTFGEASILYWKEYLKQNPDIDATKRKEIQNKLDLARKLTEISVTVTAGTAVQNQPLQSYICPDGKHVTAIVGNHDPWLNRIGIKCGPYIDSNEEGNKVRSTSNTSTSTTKSDFSLERSSGFNSIDTFYSSGGIVGLKVGDHEIGGDFDHVDTIKQTLSCRNGRIKGIKASAGGGLYNIVNQLALVCKKPKEPLSSETIRWTGKTRTTREEETKATKEQLKIAQEGCIKSGDTILINNAAYQNIVNDNYKILTHHNNELKWSTNAHGLGPARWWIHKENGGCIQSGDRVKFQSQGLHTHSISMDNQNVIVKETNLINDADLWFQIFIRSDTSNKNITWLKETSRFDLIHVTQQQHLGAINDTVSRGPHTRMLQALPLAKEQYVKNKYISSQNNCVKHGDKVYIYSARLPGYYLTRYEQHDLKFRSDDFTHGKWNISSLTRTQGDCIRNYDTVYIQSDTDHDRYLGFDNNNDPLVHNDKGNDQKLKIKLEYTFTPFIKYNTNYYITPADNGSVLLGTDKNNVYHNGNTQIANTDGSTEWNSAIQFHKA